MNDQNQATYLVGGNFQATRVTEQGDAGSD
jgi:hypothetical protein